MPPPFGVKCIADAFAVHERLNLGEEVIVFIRIVAPPPGEAPAEVRREWVGLELPLAWEEPRARVVGTGGVLSGPRTFLGKLFAALSGRTRLRHGYVIEAPQALVLLAEKAPWAARWWRECAPHCWQPGYKFVFPAECCVEVGSYADGRLAAHGQGPSDEFFPAAPAEVTRKPAHGTSSPRIQEPPAPADGEIRRGPP
jgi:hypothetical protein